MGDKKELKRRLAFAGPMVLVGVGFLAFDASAFILIWVLLLAYLFETFRAIYNSRLTT